MAAPRGNQNAAKAKVWTAAIERALDRRVIGKERVKAIDALADKLLDACADGNLAALQELGNRLEGRPAQDLNVSGELHQTHEHRTVSEVDNRITDMLGGREDQRPASASTH